MLLLAVAVASGACGKSDDTKQANVGVPSAGATTPSADKAADQAADKAAATDPTAAPATALPDPGVEAGPIAREKDEGPAAVITTADGTVEVRRVGDVAFAPAKAATTLFPGDQVRTGEQATATITMADESVIEVAEVSTIGIATREGSADPASGAAVLAGLARFTVSPRAPGEGAFKAYTPTGVVLTKGTVYAIGVAVTGEARVGVESGAVDVVGLSQVSAPPVAVEAGHAATLGIDGTVGGSAAWATDDWGPWRAEADGDAELVATIDAHGTALAELAAALAAAYADLEANAVAMAELEAKAAAAAEAKATADYQVVAPDAAATIDASFGVAGHAEALTWAYAGHAALASDIYVRHPDTVQARWEVVAPRVEASVLWPKRFVVTSSAYLEPLRVQYYVHHPRGRAHAELVGVAVPEFYAAVDVPEPPRPMVDAKVRTKLWEPPQVIVTAQARPVWIAAPDVDWRARVKVHAAPPRAKVSWYVRPPDLKAKVLVGAEARAAWKPGLAVKPPETRANLRARVKIQAPGARIKVRAPDLDAAARARMGVAVGGDGRMVVRQHAAAGADVRAKAAVGVKVQAPRVDIKAPRVEVKAKVETAKVQVKGRADAAAAQSAAAKAKLKAGAGAAVDVRAKVKVKAPPPPRIEVKGKVEAKGKIKIGR